MKTLEERVAALEAKVEAMQPIDIDLSQEWNNPVVRKDPKNWLEQGGTSFEGRRFSECPPAYLDALAGLFTWMAKKDQESGATYVSKKTGEALPTAPLKLKDAARAKAWAAKLRATGTTPAGREPGSDDDTSLPF